MRMALVGLGMMGEVHLKVYESLKDIKIVAIVDVNLDRVKSKVRNKDITFYSNLDELLENETLDFIDICSPSYLHEEQAIKAMNKGINVLCEKPISLTKESALRMLQTSRKNNVIFMVAQVIRFWPEYVYLKRCHEDQKFGKLLQACFSRISEIPSHCQNNWMTDKKKSGLAPVDLHIHDADFILYMLGKPKSIYGSLKEDVGKISYICGHYEYDDCTITVEGGWFGCPLPFSMSFRAAFEDAILEYKDNKLLVYETGKTPVELGFEDMKDLICDSSIICEDGYKNEIQYFIGCLKQDKLPEITTPSSSISSLALVEKTIESANLGQKVVIKQLTE